MKLRRVVISGLLSFLLVIFLLKFWQRASYPDSLWMVLGGLLLFGVFGLFEESTRRIAAFVLSTALGLSLAFTSVTRVTHTPDASTIDSYANGREVILHGVIAEAPDERPMKTHYVVRVDWMRSAQTHGKLAVGGFVRATEHSGWPKLHYGDEVLVKGRLKKPTQVEFPYDQYLSRFGIYSVMPSAECTYRGEGQGGRLRRFLYSLKEDFESQIDRIFPEPHASFLAGLLTGSRRGIPEHLMESFNRTGLTHILAISGYNITIVVAAILALLFFLPRKLQFPPAVTVVVLFTILVGAEASVVRAAIMGILGLLALQLGRQKDTRMAILWALTLMLLWNPKQLWYDPSFQLSFLAVLGITELHPYLSPWLTAVPRVLNFKDAFEMTIAAQLFAVPWAANIFGNFSLIAPLANVLAAPFIPLAMLLGTVGVFLSFFSFFAGQLVSYAAWACLEAIILIAQTLSAIPIASVSLPSVSVVAVSLYYVLLLSFLYYLKRREAYHS